jgi:hypothetical protein
MKGKSCRTCRFLRTPEADADGKIRYRKAYAYRCLYPVPWPALPASRLPAPGWVEITDGTDCPVWEAPRHD